MRIKSVVTLFVMLSLWTHNASADNFRYSMEDLKVLAVSQSWDELILHLNDIPPAQRDKSYQEIVRKAALGKIDSLLKSTVLDPGQAFIEIEQFHSLYPFLSTSTDWMDLRLKIGRLYFERLMRSDNSSINIVSSSSFANYLSFVKSYPQDSALAKESVENTAIAGAGADLVGFIDHWLKTSKPESREDICASSRVWPGLNKALSLPLQTEQAQTAKKILFEDCWDALVDRAKHALSDSSAGSSFAINTCDSFRAKGVTAHFMTKVCGQ